MSEPLEPELFDPKLYVAAYRGHRARKKVAEDQRSQIKAKLEASVVQLQAGESTDPRRAPRACADLWSSSVCRSYLARKKYQELREEKNRAATKIQARYRGHRERRSFRRKR